MSTLEVYHDLLVKSAATFREYEANHLAKVDNWKRQIDEATSPQAIRSLEAQICDTQIKAAANGNMASQIEEALKA
jgi:hypothetical protein